MNHFFFRPRKARVIPKHTGTTQLNFGKLEMICLAKGLFQQRHRYTPLTLHDKNLRCHEVLGTLEKRSTVYTLYFSFGINLKKHVEQLFFVAALQHQVTFTVWRSLIDIKCSFFVICISPFENPVM